LPAGLRVTRRPDGNLVRAAGAGEEVDVLAKKGLVVAAIAASAVAAGCSKRSTSEPALATPTITVNHARAALGSPIEITYQFVVASDVPKVDQRYRVFVHFLDSSGELMWTDDHEPPVPTTDWTPGKTIAYTRTVFVPIYPYVGDATVRLGLYSDAKRQRVTLAGEDNGQRAYKVATLTLLPQSENVFLIYKDGWHPAEVSSDNAAVEWQWSKREGLISFRNPKRDATLFLHLDGRPDLAGRPQKVTVTLAGQTLESFDLATRDEVIRKIPITAAQFGGADMVDLRLTVDPTFVPAQIPSAGSADQRELGVRVFHAFVEPR
jgi:hypothetical protein